MNEYQSDTHLVELKAVLNEYFPHNIKETIKPKRDMAIAKAYEEIFDIQFEAITIISDIEISHLLGMNEVVVPIIVEEYTKLSLKLKELEASFKDIKQFNELKSSLDRARKAAKISEISNCLYKDLEYLSATFEIDIDAKTYVSEMKKAVA
jgi:hypothetical protein